MTSEDIASGCAMAPMSMTEYLGAAGAGPTAPKVTPSAKSLPTVKPQASGAHESPAAAAAGSSTCRSTSQDIQPSRQVVAGRPIRRAGVMQAAGVTQRLRLGGCD